jgi:hypothetical protein
MYSYLASSHAVHLMTISNKQMITSTKHCVPSSGAFQAEVVSFHMLLAEHFQQKKHPVGSTNHLK